MYLGKSVLYIYCQDCCDGQYVHETILYNFYLHFLFCFNLIIKETC